MKRRDRRVSPALRRKAKGLRPSAAAEGKYVKALVRILRAAGEAFARDAEATIRARGDSKISETAPRALAPNLEILSVSEPSRVDALCTRRDAIRPPGAVAARAGKLAGNAYDTMVESVLTTTRKGLRAFEVNVVGLDKELAKAVKERRAENVELVTNATKEMRAQMVAVLEEAGPGVRWEDVAPKIAERAGVGEYRAEVIARDQALTSAAEISRIAQEEAGFEEYEWSTSGDNRVRDEHEEREGQIFRWDDPPEDGHPGEPILCRCVAIPVAP